MPPNMKNVIRWTGIPRASATTEWPSSWASSDAKKSRVMARAMASRTGVARSGKSAGSDMVASIHITSATMTNQDGCTRSSIPRIRPIRKPVMPEGTRLRT
jgi:hypothetical protein